MEQQKEGHDREKTATPGTNDWEKTMTPGDTGVLTQTTCSGSNGSSGYTGSLFGSKDASREAPEDECGDTGDRQRTLSRASSLDREVASVAQLSRVGSLDKDFHEFLDSMFSREVVEHASRPPLQQWTGQASRHPGLPAAGEGWRPNHSAEAALEGLAQQELQLGQDLADGLTKVLAEELRGSVPADVLPRPNDLAPQHGVPLANMEPATPPLAQLQSGSSTRLHDDKPLATVAPASLGHATRMPSSLSDASAAESSASYGIPGSPGTDGGCGVKALATIEGEEALFTILDKLLVDAERSTRASSYSQRAEVHCLPHGQADEPVLVSGTQDGEACLRFDDECSSVASMRLRRPVDEWQLRGEAAQWLWQEVRCRLDQAVLPQPPPPEVAAALAAAALQPPPPSAKAAC